MASPGLVPGGFGDNSPCLGFLWDCPPPCDINEKEAWTYVTHTHHGHNSSSRTYGMGHAADATVVQRWAKGDTRCGHDRPVLKDKSP